MRVLIAVLLVIVAVVVVVVGWTLYENLFTPAAIEAPATINTAPTPAGALSPTAARALNAYGGADLWNNATSVDSTVTVGGALFQVKGIYLPPHATISVDVRNPHTVIKPVDADGDIGVMDGFSVTIQSPSGAVLLQVADARDLLEGASFSEKWDRVHLVYFLGYAFWGYYTLPYELTRSDIQWTEPADDVLQADYGTNLPVHSRIQRYWFDKQTGLLRRNDYTAMVVTSDTATANVIFAHGFSNGVPYTSKRRVMITPAAQHGWVLPFPEMVIIDVESWQLH